MLLRRPIHYRTAPLLRPLRPPSTLTSPARPRLFTQNHPLLLLTRTSTPRPQLPYLSQPSRNSQLLLSGPGLQRQLARLLTTETRTYVKEQTYLALKWSAVGWTMVFLLSMAWYGWRSELVEREHPSPVEWSYWTRAAFRSGHARQDPDFDDTGITDWAKVGTDFRHCLERLENQQKDGKGIFDAATGSEDGLTMIDGVGRAGYDVSSKSYAWRAGYFEVIMTCAKAAEFLDGMVRDKTRKLVFPMDVVIGPSNPNPRPMPPGGDAAPLEENCDKPYAAPETFYMRVITGLGFSTRQKLDAALAYANWLEFKEAWETAEEMYRWAIAIAAQPLLPSEDIVDAHTGILSGSSEATATPNVLRASTALATHFARTGDVSSALPIYLSVLRARRSAPVDPTAAALSAESVRPQSTDYGSLYSMFRSLIRSSAYPAEGPSGDEPLVRSLDAVDCSEAELMLYIGEILFATATTRPDEGVGWTKRAVEIAQKGAMSKAIGPKDVKQCKDCLQIGVANWMTMAKRLAKQELEVREREGNAAKGWRWWYSSRQKDHEAESYWEEEAKSVQTLQEKLIRDGITEQMTASGGAPGGVWIG